MKLNEKILIGFLNKEVKLETSRNSYIIGTLTDWDLEGVTIEKQISIEPYRAKQFKIDRFIIKTIKLLEPEAKKEPEKNTAFFEKFEEKKE